ncbi:MAG: NAD(P)H-binding protein [Dehalococcoidia bacterium]|nr:NAD(P)H-binding protein [Dehalococcoidia bacterium]
MILVAGASGCVGSALVADLQRHPGPSGTPRHIRAFVRREFDAVRLRDQGVEAVTGDLVTGRGVDEAMRGVRTLVYLVDTRDHDGDIVTNDLEAVQHTLIAARAAGVSRVVALSHVAAAEDARSRYLVARWAVELAVTQSGLDWLILRAPIILGQGCTPWTLLQRLVDRSPVVPLFRWRRVEVEPVALSDVVEALRLAVDERERSGQSFDVTGASRIDFGRLVRGWGRASGARRLYVPLPGWGTRELTAAGWTVARLPRDESRLLVETLQERQVCTDPSRRFPLGRRPLTYEAALSLLR